MRFTAEFPRSVDVREVHRALTTVFPDVEVVGYRTKRRVSPPRPSGDLLADAGLTERQRTVLELAHHSGYFAWPKRSSSPTDLATTLGIAPQTFLEHLRRGEAKLVAAAFDAKSPSSHLPSHGARGEPVRAPLQWTVTAVVVPIS